MKKIFSIILLLLLFLTSCGKDKQTDFTKLCSYVEKLESYSLDGEMTIYRQNREIKTNVKVDYLKPNYYKVTFQTDNGYEQIILKNDDGVYVLTPSINKEFKFDSNWPLNSKHVYLLTSVIKELKNNNSLTKKTDGDILTCEVSLDDTNPNFKKLVFKYNTKDKKPVSASFNNNKDEVVILFNFNSFTANSKLKKDDFAKNTIMNEESAIKETKETNSISVSYVIDGSTLESSKEVDEYYVMCYKGEDVYTIVVKNIELDYDDVVVENYDKLAYFDCGVIVGNEKCYRCYMYDKEVIIFTNTLDINEASLIISGITLS